MNSLAEIIRAETARRGVLPFARFMELALYHPKFGYYESPENSPGQHGDFYTSVSTGDLFGQLLACQFARWLEDFSTGSGKYWIIEAGAHDGRLAADILTWLQSNRPGLFARVEYGILEPSRRRQKWQRETLKTFAPCVRWFNDFQSLCSPTPNSELRTPKLNGIVFSNELLDAMPVQRFGWDAGAKNWFEWGVAQDDDKFVWAKILNSELRTSNSELPSSILHLPSSLLDVLPDCYTIEFSPAAENWWRNAAQILSHGKLLTIDYGFTAEEMLSPARTRGTLRAYSRHHVADDPLANPGEQDLTAHVNFFAIQKAGEDAGLKTEYFDTQAKFLTEILATANKDGSLGKLVAPKPSEGGFGTKQARQFQTLTHPEHLGRAFRVLVQSR